MSEITSDIEVLNRLGVGSFGEEYFRAKHVSTGDIVLLKKQAKEHNKPQTDNNTEVNILSKCHSPFIVSFLGSFVVPNPPSPPLLCTVLEYCESGSMSSILKRVIDENDALIPEACVRAAIASVALALDYLHRTVNVYHRDIRCKNILLTKNGQVKLSGFQQAIDVKNALRRRAAVSTGSVHWIAPEVLQDTFFYDGHADIWSLGITLIEMAQGTPPHATLSPEQASLCIPAKVAPSLSDPDEWSPEMLDFQRDCCQKDPSKRPDSVLSLTRHPFIKQEVFALKEMHSFHKNQHLELSPTSVVDSSPRDANISGLPALIWLVQQGTGT